MDARMPFHGFVRLITALGIIVVATDTGRCNDSSTDISPSTIVVQSTNTADLTMKVVQPEQQKNKNAKTKAPRVVVDNTPKAASVEPQKRNASAHKKTDKIVLWANPPKQNDVRLNMPAAERISLEKIDFAKQSQHAEMRQPISVAQRISQSASPAALKAVDNLAQNDNRFTQTSGIQTPAAPVNSPVYLAATTDNSINRNIEQPIQTAAVSGMELAQVPSPPSLDGALTQNDPAIPPTASTSTPSDQTIGEAPRNYNLEFLRRQSVLLRPCEWQLDIGVSYLYYEHYFTSIVLPSETLYDYRIRRRLLTTPLEFRYGLNERIQLFANTQFGWTNTEVSTTGADIFENNGGIGDTSFGASILLFKSSGPSYSPDVVATFGLTAPTSNGSSVLGVIESSNNTLGQGFWAGYWSLLFVHQYDPMIVFYGFGSRHCAEKRIGGYEAKPGDQYTYQLGSGFAVNDRITLSTTFFGSFVSEAVVDGDQIEGTMQEPMYLRFAITIARPPKQILEPFVEVGLTSDAPNARVGVNWTF